MVYRCRLVVDRAKGSIVLRRHESPGDRSTGLSTLVGGFVVAGIVLLTVDHPLARWAAGGVALMSLGVWLAGAVLRAGHVLDQVPHLVGADPVGAHAAGRTVSTSFDLQRVGHGMRQGPVTCDDLRRVLDCEGLHGLIEHSEPDVDHPAAPTVRLCLVDGLGSQRARCRAAGLPALVPAPLHGGEGPESPGRLPAGWS